MRLVRSKEALTDVEDIWLYIQQDNQMAADKVLDRIDATIDLLLTQPKMGRVRDELVPGLRSFPTKYPYTIFYSLSEDTLTIVRVLHQARDFDSIFHDLTTINQQAQFV